MTSNLQIPTIRYLAAGSLAVPDVFRGLTGIPEEKIRRFTLPDHGLRVQPLENVRPNWVREDLTGAWKERGLDFYGGITLFPSEGETADVAMGEMTQDHWRRYAVPRLMFWNYHRYDIKEEGWYRFQGLWIPVPGEGIVRCFAEVLPKDSDLFRLREGFQNESHYKHFGEIMGRDIRDNPELQKIALASKER